MSKLLIVFSAAWLAVFVQAPALHPRAIAFFITLGFISINALVSLRTLTQRREVLVGLNCAQIVLFGTLNYQLYCAFGAAHYRCEREPRFYDWIEFTAAHVLRAADILDALDEYGVPIQSITHNSTSAGILLVCMHLTVDVFLIGLALRWANRYWQDGVRETRLARGRRECAWLLATLGLYVSFGVLQQLRPSDWFLWPLDNLLRLLDVGDIMQVFGWQLHSVEANYWTRGVGLLFRLTAGIWIARLVSWVRLTVFRTWGLSIDELTELLDDPDPQVRKGAATGLGRSGKAAESAAPELIAGLQDMNREVRCEAAWALGQIGPGAHEAVGKLLDAVWLGHRQLRLAAAEALGWIGPNARSAVYSLISLLKVCDEETRRVATAALNNIAPEVVKDLPALEASDAQDATTPPVKPPKKKPWQHSLEAASLLHGKEDVIRDFITILVQEGFFTQARDTDSLRSALAAKGHDVQFAQLFMPLLMLTTEGTLSRRQNELGRWVYRAAVAGTLGSENATSCTPRSHAS
jgi:hypothetical protein